MRNLADFGYIRVAAASIEVDIAAPSVNTQRILALAEQWVRDGVTVGVLPELCLSGYSAEDLFFNETLLDQCRVALADLCSQTGLPLLVVGLPWRLQDGRLLNCAAAISDGRLLGVVPKSVHPNYGEFYDLRWFVPGAEVNETILDPVLGQFQIRRDQLFRVADTVFGIEICEDLWAPVSPACNACLAGAEIILNLSASNELIAKADYRRQLISMASARNICGYVYASAAATESTKDIVFGGHCLIAENGTTLAEGERFQLTGGAIAADIDVHKLRHDRSQNQSFAQAPRPRSFRITEGQTRIPQLSKLLRPNPQQPFVPDDEHEFSARAAEILNIQSTGLARRVRAAHAKGLVLAVSGGLDSTMAYLVCLEALSKLEYPIGFLHAITMPGPGTTSLTRSNAENLARSTGANLHTISIAASVQQHLKDLQHAGEHDVVFENAQARERTQILFNYANKVDGIVVGTGDLSELALGWCTFNADHMAGYNVNASVPKTLIAYLVRWYANHRAGDELRGVLEDVLATPISPELIPPEDGEISQKTEAIVGPYELHDFFLYHFLRNGSRPGKIYQLATLSFDGKYAPAEIKHWLSRFIRRFFAQQFKRTTLPPGPKVGSVSLSPRGDWRMPDEANASPWIEEVDNL